MEWRSKLLAATTKKARKRAESKYRHSQIKQALIQMFGGKCAYCESRITHVDYGHIEHFQPKAGMNGHPELTFEWSNLLLACGICNGPEFKGERFPSHREGGPLVNPCQDEPTDHFEFVFDIKTLLASVDGVTSRGVVTKKTLELNRPELRDYRSVQIRKMVMIAILARTNPEAARLLEEAKQGNGEYAAFVRVLNR
jgi:uncharacterized protein (TIGR02646 family)